MIKGKDLHFVKNHKDKVIVRCKVEGCKYRVYGSQVTNEMTFQIKTLNPTHTCTRAYKNSACTSRWISKRYMQKFRYDLNCPTAGLQKEIKDKFHVDVGRMQVYRARKSAEKVIDGDGNEQYNRFWDYCETLKATNVGTTTLMLVDRPTLDVAGTFQRLYICLQATKEGFKAGCRPLIGLDGCFLKGNQKGQILSVVGRDANDNMYPIAMAIVETESKDSWSWFLDCLLKDLGPVEQHGWAFISDRQKAWAIFIFFIY